MKPGTKEYRKANLETMLAWSLDKKIYHALKRINEFYIAQEGKVYVAFSGGKDSSVLLHLVRGMYPDVVAVFSNTTNEYIEILQHVRNTPNVIWLQPKMTFKETIQAYGFPLVSKRVARQITDLREDKPETANTRNLYLTGLNQKGHYCKDYVLAKKWYPLFDKEETLFDITSKCCKILKEDPTHEFEKTSGLKGYVGTQAGEGRQREKNWLDFGCNIYEGKSRKSRPLSIWTEADIWEYIKRFDVPYSDIYNDKLDADGNVLIPGEKRTGCAYCAFGAHLEKGTNRFQRLALRKPHQFEKMMNLTSNGVTFREALSAVGVPLTIDKPVNK